MELDPSLWLSTVRAAPSVGIHSRPTYESGTELLSLVRPLIQKWTPESKEIELTLNAFDLKIDEDTGFITSVSNKTASTSFTYKGSVQDDGVSGPMLRFVSAERPIKDLLDECIGKLLSIFSELQKNRRREIELLGIVVGGRTSLANPPPGFRDFFRHFQVPWEAGEVTAGKLAFSVDLSKSDGHVDRCHHVIEWNSQAEPKVIGFKLDWQRKFNEPKMLSHSHLVDNVGEVAVSALEYFGKFGSGDLCYVD